MSHMVHTSAQPLLINSSQSVYYLTTKIQNQIVDPVTRWLMLYLTKPNGKSEINAYQCLFQLNTVFTRWPSRRDDPKYMSRNGTKKHERTIKLDLHLNAKVTFDPCIGAEAQSSYWAYRGVSYCFSMEPTKKVWTRKTTRKQILTISYLTVSGFHFSKLIGAGALAAIVAM